LRSIHVPEREGPAKKAAASAVLPQPLLQPFHAAFAMPVPGQVSPGPKECVTLSRGNNIFETRSGWWVGRYTNVQLERSMEREGWWVVGGRMGGVCVCVCVCVLCCGEGEGGGRGWRGQGSAAAAIVDRLQYLRTVRNT